MVYYSREIPDLDIEANIEELLKQAGGLADSDSVFVITTFLGRCGKTK